MNAPKCRVDEYSDFLWCWAAGCWGLTHHPGQAPGAFSAAQGIVSASAISWWKAIRACLAAPIFSPGTIVEFLNQSSDENHMHYATNYVGFTCASV